MPLYQSKCSVCGATHSYVSKIADRYKTPICCDQQTEKILDAPSICAQTISGLIYSSDGAVHEGRAAFEKHLQKNDLIHGSDAKSEAAHNRTRINTEIKNERRKTLEKLIGEN